MFDFIEFPKLYAQYKLTKDSEALKRCKATAEDYKIFNSKLKTDNFDLPYDLTVLDELEEKWFQVVNNNEPVLLDEIKDTVGCFYVAMEFKRLVSLLNKLLLLNNTAELLSWLYITLIYQRWFADDEINLTKNIAATKKKLDTYLSKNKLSPELSKQFLLMTILGNLNNFKTEFNICQITFDKDISLQELDELKFGDEYLIVMLVVFLLTKPFTSIQFSDELMERLAVIAPNLLNLLTNLKKFKLLDFSNIEEDLNRIAFLNDSNVFIQYFETMIRYKWFLNLMSFTSKISAKQVQLLQLTNKDQTQHFIFLIASLNLNRYGIGYNFQEEYFYNNPTNSDNMKLDLGYEMNKINHLLTSQKNILNVTNELINQYVDL